MLTLPAELTHRQAASCLQGLLHELQSASETTAEVDAAALTTFDSSALAVLLACRRAALQQGRSFAVRALPPALASLAGLYGVQELLTS